MQIQFTSKTVLFFLLTMLFSYGGMVASSNADQPTNPAKLFKSISPLEANALLQKRNDVLFLDVRTPQERAQGAIAGSELVSIWDLIQGRISLPKDKAILLVCAVGGRSYAAGKILSQRGYQEVYNLSGGINAWYKQGLPIM
jgi:rhodanese-related sulfurtransferase